MFIKSLCNLYKNRLFYKIWINAFTISRGYIARLYTFGILTPTETTIWTLDPFRKDSGYVRGLGFLAMRNRGRRHFLSVRPGNQSSCRLNCVCGENPWSMFALSGWRGRRGVEDVTRKPFRCRVICLHCCCCWCRCHCCCWSTASSPGYSVAWLTLSHQFPQKGRTGAYIRTWKTDTNTQSTRSKNEEKMFTETNEIFKYRLYIMNRARNSNWGEKIL